MGLLDSVLGSVLAGQNQQGGGLGGLGEVLGGMLGGQQQPQQPQGGTGGLNMGLVAALAPILMSMLANNSSQGGLGGLLDKFTHAGAGDAAGSWVGSGANQPVSPDQVTQALGPDVISQIAAQLGISPYHLQRTFSVWAGISPKRFLQYLTSEHARSLLRAIQFDTMRACDAFMLSVHHVRPDSLKNML